MEIHPILECGDTISHGLWYVISSEHSPQARVGMACVTRKDENDQLSEIFVLGGANPSCTFSDIYKLDLRTFSWFKMCSDGLQSRYEHFAFTPCSEPNTIYTFGGSNESGNLNSMQAYNIESDSWSEVGDMSHCPTPRTIHCAGWAGDKMFIYSGGFQGADPVPDQTLHVFCSKDKRWSKHDLIGEAPSPRHGHVMVVMGSKLYIHGGMAGTNFYDDLFVIDLSSFKCLKLKEIDYWPCARAGHCSSTFHSKFFIFGGMCLTGALDDMSSYNITTLSWTLLKFDCPPPPPRLDHSMVCAMLPVKKCGTVNGNEASNNTVKKSPDHASDTSSVNSSNTSSTSSKPNIVPIDDWQVTVDGSAENLQKLNLVDAEKTEAKPSAATLNGHVDYDFVPVCIILGGMDTAGNIFNDVFVTRVDV